MACLEERLVALIERSDELAAAFAQHDMDLRAFARDLPAELETLRRQVEAKTRLQIETEGGVARRRLTAVPAAGGTR